MALNTKAGRAKAKGANRLEPAAPPVVRIPGRLPERLANRREAAPGLA